MTDQPVSETQAAPKPPKKTDVPKLIAAMVLLAVAGYLVSARYAASAVDWYLGDLRRNPADLEALRAFSRMGDRAVPRLAEELQGKDANGRVIAVLALSVIPGDAAAEALIFATRDEDLMTASNAVAALGLRRDAKSACTMSACLGDRRYGVRHAAREAAQKRSGGLPWWAFGGGGTTQTP